MNRATARLFCLLVLLCFGAAGSLLAQREDKADQAQAAQAEQARHFENDIAPLLTRYCLECHGLTAKKARLDLTRKELAFKGGLGGPAIIPGKPEESLLWEYIESGEMPPDNRPQMSARDKQLIKKWIADGAVWSKERIGPMIFTDQRIEPHREFECNDDGGDPGPTLVRRLTVPEYIETVRSAVGVDIGADARQILPPDVRADGFSNTAYNLNIDLANIEAYAQLAAIIVARMDVPAFVGDFAQSRDMSDSHMRQVISKMGKWLLRRPLDDQEVGVYLNVAKAVAGEGGDFIEAVSYIIEAMLQSPRFLYLIEDQSGDGAVRRVGDFELASRMSYILWGGPPDKELLRAAEAGELSNPSRVESQIQRMLDDPRAVERSARFIHDWLNLDQLSTLRPDKNRFPQWNEQLAADMREETLAFFKYVAWDERRPLTELMNAQVAFATPLLASHYGLDQQHIVDEPKLAETPSAADRATDGLQALYTFEEGKGDTVRDVSQSGESLDLKIGDSSAVSWSADGLSVNAPTLIARERLPHRLIDALRKSGEITVEAWITPANSSQDGPARIFTLSRDAVTRNFTLGQDGDRVDIRLRTTATSNSGTPSVSSSSGAAGAARTHVVYTRHKSGDVVIYVNGQESSRGKVEGDFSTWEDRCRLAFANELSKDRPWQGTLHLAAIYDRALSVTEIHRNHAAGARRDGSNAVAAAQQSPNKRNTDGLQALYRFDEGGGDTIRDSAPGGRPLHMKIEDASAVKWTPQGLTINGSTVIGTDGPPKQLIEAVKKSRAITLEAWITPADTKQDGPARILTLSSGSSTRNFTLGQEGDKYDVRLRTTTRDANGLPSLSTPGGVVATQPTHVVYTRTQNGTGLIYINGQEQRQVGRAVDGTLSNWDGGFRLMLGNESTKDRPWRGTLHLAAVYDRALSAKDVRQNFAAGARGDGKPVAAIAASQEKRTTNGLQVLYQFDEGRGDTVRDRADVGKSLNLKIENASRVRWDSQGLNVDGKSQIGTAEPPKRLIDAIKKSRAMTVEAWVTPGNTTQAGPARILTLSSGTGARNFTLGQDGNKYEVRFRTNRTNPNGEPAVSSPSGSVETRPTHVVYTRDSSGKAVLYLDGQQAGARNVGGNLSNWDDGFHLMVGNESTNDRPWQGALHLAAVYDRALSADEVQQNFAAGAGVGVTPPPALAGGTFGVVRGRQALQAVYRFDEGGGNTIRDQSNVGVPLDLTIEDTSAVRWSPGGLTVNGSTLIATAGPPLRLIDAIKESQAITLEAWVTPADTRQDGPARILTLSSGIGARNFTLGQDGDKFDVRFRTTTKDQNGLPSISSPSGTAQTRPTHVVYTRGTTGTGLIYVNGEEQACRDVDGNLSNWDSAFRLMLGNESSKDRPWQGTFHFVAVYSRALTPEEIRSQGGGLARYDVASVPSRGGLLTQGSVLTMGGDEASMVARGLFVLNDLLCSQVGDPPPCVDATPVPTKPGVSNRAAAEMRLADNSCAGCHTRFEPLAFGLEKFDGIGAFHEKDEHGNTLRDDGAILFPRQEEPISYQTSAELMDLLAGSERISEAFTLKLTQFALGRPLVETDACHLDKIHKQALQGGGTYQSLITAILMSDLVQMTRTEKE